MELVGAFLCESSSLAAFVGAPASPTVCFVLPHSEAACGSPAVVESELGPVRFNPRLGPASYLTSSRLLPPSLATSESESPFRSCGPLRVPKDRRPSPAPRPNAVVPL